MSGINTSVDLILPSTPNTLDPELFNQLLIIYNAIRSLALGLDDYTEAGDLNIHLHLAAAINAGQVSQLRQEIKELREEISHLTTNWGQPGEIGANIANVVNATDVNVAATVTTVDVKTTTISATGNASLTDTTTGKLGVNGNSASGKLVLPANASDLTTVIALANALKNLTSTFGFST